MDPFSLEIWDPTDKELSAGLPHLKGFIDHFIFLRAFSKISFCVDFSTLSIKDQCNLSYGPLQKILESFIKLLIFARLIQSKETVGKKSPKQ